MSNLTYDDYLAHYGIKGMKWGVRRKPGPDGTVGTGSGKTKTNKSKMSDATKVQQAKKKARKKGVGSLSNEELKTVKTRRELEKNANLEGSRKRKRTSEDASRAKRLEKNIKRKGVGNLDNNELQSVITRMELQNRYDSLKKQNSKVESGKSFMKDILVDAAKNVTTEFVEDAMRNAAQGAGNAARNQYNSRRNDRNRTVSTSNRRALPPGRR